MNTETITGPFVGMTTYVDMPVVGRVGWRSRCIVEKAKDGSWDVWSHDRTRYLASTSLPSWHDVHGHGAIDMDAGCFSNEYYARSSLSKAPPYPGAEA